MRNLFSVLWIIFICSFSVVFAQNEEIDSLKKVLKNYAESDTNYINNLNELAFIYYTINPDTTLILAEKALSISQEIRYEKGQVEALKNKGIAADIKGDYAQALKLYFEALPLAEKIGYKKGIASLYNNMAIIYDYQGEIPKALENYLKALKINKEVGDKKKTASTLNNIALIYTEQGKYTEALENYFKSLKIKKEIGDRKSIATSLNNIAFVYEKQGKYTEALENYFKALAIKEEMGDKSGAAISKNGLANIYLTLKNYVLALKYAQEGLQTAKEIEEKVLIRDMHEITANIYEATGKVDKALFHYKQFKIHADSLNNWERDKKSATLQAKYEFDKKSATLQAKYEFDKETALIQAEQEKQKNRFYWLIFSAFVGFISLSSILFLIFRSRKKIQKAYSELTISNAQVQQAKIEIEVQAEELQKLNQFKDKLFSIIAHDLRSPMATLQGTINILDPDILSKSELATIKAKLTKQFEATDKILKDLLQWTRNQMQGEIIRPISLNIDDIANEKINLFTATAQNKNIALLNEVTPHTQVFADENHLNIILQNLLSNALKFTYSGGSITITSQNIDKMVQISVKDTGKGFNEEQQSKLFSAQYFTTKGTAGENGNGLGLNLVKDLVEKNGGKIWVKSEEGKGSEFCLLLPVSQN